MRNLTVTTTRLFLISALVTGWLCALMPVFAQESYYWTYAEHPALSYFDHPPMVAWLIWLGTSVFGDSAIGIRFGTWACGVGTAWFGLLLLRDFGVGVVGQRIWLLIGIGSPILIVTRVLANPDPALVCFWTLTLLALWRARGGKLGWWLLAGFAAGLALLSKYTAGFLAITGVSLFLFDERLRRQLKSPAPYLAVLLATIVFLPVILWNLDNDFESFRFQTANRFEQGHLTGHWLLHLVGGQFGLLNPLLAVLMPVSIVWLLRRSGRDPRMVLLLAAGLPLPLYMLVQSLWIQVKLNWLSPAYVPLFLGVAMWWAEAEAVRWQQRLKGWAVRSMVWLQVLTLAAPLIRAVPVTGGTTWSGWEEIAERAEVWEDRVDAEDGVEGNIFFFAADYRDSSQLGRSLLLLSRAQGPREVLRDQPHVGETTMAQNVVGCGALQFDHWESPARHIGQNAIFVLPRPERRRAVMQQITPCFHSVERVEQMAIKEFGVHVLDADIYVCRGYRGPARG